jgi:hypothetical protein
VTDDAGASAPDPGEILRSRGLVVLLIFAALVGIIVSFASWAFLELVHRTQQGLFTNLPDALNLSSIPAWWYLLVLDVAGLPVAFAITRLPGEGGHVPAHRLQAGSNQPNIVPGVALAAFVTLSFGLVLGPEAPLIAMGDQPPACNRTRSAAVGKPEESRMPILFRATPQPSTGRQSVRSRPTRGTGSRAFLRPPTGARNRTNTPASARTTIIIQGQSARVRDC